MTLQDKLAPSSTALLVVDLQNDFCGPMGLMARLGKNISGMDEMIEQTKRLISVCEQASVPVFYTQQIYDRAKLTDLQKEQYDLDGKMVTCDIEGDGYKFYKLTPPPKQVFPKYSYNVFSNPNLGEALTKNNIKTLIITGVSTQICVETAIRNAFDIGYKIVVPRDLIATTSHDPFIQERTLRLVDKTYGTVVDSVEIINILKNSYKKTINNRL